MNFNIARFFTLVVFLFISITTFSQESTAIEGTWIIDSIKNDNTISTASQKLDSISFKNQDYRYYTGIDSLNSQGRFILQGDFIALYPDQETQGFKKFDLKKVAGDSLSLKVNESTYNLLLRKEVVIEKNVEIKNDLGFSFESFYRGLIGMVFILGLCYVLSKNRKKIDWRLVIVGITLQIVFAISVLKFESVAYVFDSISTGVVRFLAVSEAGAEFVFGNLIDVKGSWGYVFAFKVLPTIIFFSAFTSLLYYLGILQKVVYVLAWIMSKTMRLSGAESLAAAANIFIGQTEAPLVVKPYLEKMTKSEILCLMVGGMATIAGGVLAAFIGFLGGESEAQQILFTKHLLTASIMSAPAAIVIAKMLFPEEDKTKIDRSLKVSKDKIGSNILDAISRGTTDGLKLAVNVGAMLLVFTALIAVVNFGLKDLIGEYTGLNAIIESSSNGRYDGFSMQYILGNLFAPIAWIIGVHADDIVLVGQLLGEKTILNEFIAYGSLKDLKEAGKIAHPKSIIIATYALCGFANFASIGIQIGGIGVLAPGQRKTLAAFGIKALIGGTCAALLTATIAGMLFG
ncbi:CNT family concentrative nucleoside transporter [Nonlabens dokdonensis]|uniref:Sodium/nucleoside co-transporter permease n=2 Tax=Nonlabens dokdonensis TaxID=328515 RepID=L7WB84_NONDD|nr:nucleoside transporter C-terminal domain-containing protein [Nonlabens dokdonensis]AGC76163.1 sodium/nucleoside co-transporter permease [Nonlabens dokdonensis DSW-6]PZX43831.1 CNT family concentrative nucleoside transporter [Nonlabens dokdonensis]